MVWNQTSPQIESEKPFGYQTTPGFESEKPAGYQTTPIFAASASRRAPPSAATP